MGTNIGDTEAQIVREYEFLWMKYIQTGDISYLISIGDMIKVDAVKLMPKHTGKISWIMSPRSSNCCRCKKKYKKGTRIFLRDSQGWHTECATEGEKGSCNAFQKFLKDGNVRKHKMAPDANSAPANDIQENKPAEYDGGYSEAEYGSDVSDLDPEDMWSSR